MSSYEAKLEVEKRATTLHLLFQCARLLNEQALAQLPETKGPRPTPAHMALLPHIALQDGTRITELANQLGISKQAVGQLVDDLETMRVVERKPDPEDGRAKRVVFTKLGRASILEGLSHLQSLERKLTLEVGRKTMDQLRAALLVLSDHLQP